MFVKEKTHCYSIMLDIIKTNKAEVLMYKKVKKDGKRFIYLFDLKILTYKSRSLRKKDRFYKKYEDKLKDFSEIGINNNSGRSPRIIVSLTSYPARIKGIDICLHSLLTQTLKPDMVILWLSKENFPNKEADLPSNVIKLQNNGLTIKWYRDIKSYKKLIPTLKEFPKDIIITTDDDVIYSENMIEKIYKNYLNHPRDISAHCITKLEFKETWESTYKKHYSYESYLNLSTGVGGVLYPPDSLHKDVLDESLFMRLAPTNDDLWFWCQAIRNKTKSRVVDGFEQNILSTRDSQDMGLWKINREGPNLFWKDFKTLIHYYPDLEKRLLLELKEKTEVIL